MSDSSGIYKHVRGLERGLHVLVAMNTMQRPSVADIANATGLHRTTVKRLAETLVEEGYLRKSSSDDSFRLTMKVRALSEGYHGADWVSEEGARVMGTLLQKVTWPSDLTTLDGDCMIIRETTHRYSPLSFNRNMVGVRMPVLRSAAGRAYFAHCTQAEREAILELIRRNGGNQSGYLDSPSAIEDLIERTRTAGYGWNHKEWEKESHISAIAVPICGPVRPLGSLSIVFLGSVMSPAVAAEKYLVHLRSAAAEIESYLRRQSSTREIPDDSF